jgi:hypothetical protein
MVGLCIQIKSRKQSPRRSLSPTTPTEKQKMGIIKLDVYKHFLENPSALLYKQKKEDVIISPTDSFVEPVKRGRGRPRKLRSEGCVSNNVGQDFGKRK